MSSTDAGAATVIHIDDANATGKAPVTAAPPPATGTSAAAAAVPAQRKARSVPFLLSSGAQGLHRCMGLLDFLLRLAAFGATLAAAISTGTSDERLSVFTQFFQFHARFDDFPAFTFFMVGNAIAAGYLVASLPFSCVGIIRAKAKAATGIRVALLVCDMVMVGLVTASASAAAAVVYVAHEGNLRANWVPICMQFHGFCQRTSGAVVASFVAVLLLMLLVLIAACSIRTRRPRAP